MQIYFNTCIFSLRTEIMYAIMYVGRLDVEYNVINDERYLISYSYVNMQ